MSTSVEFNSKYDVPAYMAEGVERALNQIAASGVRWSGTERVEIANIARAAKARTPRPDHTVSHEVAALAEALATHAHSITEENVDAFAENSGRGAEAFVEMIGIVARVVAIDTFATGIGADLIAFPDPDPSPPSGETREAARKRSAFVPTVGPAGATTALSAVQSEDRAQEDLHGSLYLSYFEMGDLHINKGLPRWQLELIAARTSLINDCYF